MQKFFLYPHGTFTNEHKTQINSVTKQPVETEMDTKLRAILKGKPTKLTLDH